MEQTDKASTAGLSLCCNAKWRRRMIGTSNDDFCSKCGRCKEWESFGGPKTKEQLKQEGIGELYQCLDCSEEFGVYQNPFYDTACPFCCTLNIVAL